MEMIQGLYLFAYLIEKQADTKNSSLTQISYNFPKSKCWELHDAEVSTPLPGIFEVLEYPIISI